MTFVQRCQLVLCLWYVKCVSFIAPCEFSETYPHSWRRYTYICTLSYPLDCVVQGTRPGRLCRLIETYDLYLHDTILITTINLTLINRPNKPNQLITVPRCTRLMTKWRFVRPFPDSDEIWVVEKVDVRIHCGNRSKTSKHNTEYFKLCLKLFHSKVSNRIMSLSVISLKKRPYRDTNTNRSTHYISFERHLAVRLCVL